MCLFQLQTNVDVALKGKKQYPNGMYKLWKVIYKTGNSVICYHEWKHGWNHSNRKSSKVTKSESHNDHLNPGFHLFLTRKEARKYSAYSNKDLKIIPVFVSKKDFVAAGTSNLTWYRPKSIVFNKVYVDKNSKECKTIK